MPPKSDLSKLTIRKDDPPVPPPALPPMQGAGAGKGHTLSLRLDAAKYQQLRRHAITLEERTGRRVTHQAIIEAALDAYLDRDAGK